MPNITSYLGHFGARLILYWYLLSFKSRSITFIIVITWPSIASDIGGSTSQEHFIILSFVLAANLPCLFPLAISLHRWCLIFYFPTLPRYSPVKIVAWHSFCFNRSIVYFQLAALTFYYRLISSLHMTKAPKWSIQLSFLMCSFKNPSEIIFDWQLLAQPVLEIESYSHKQSRCMKVAPIKNFRFAEQDEALRIAIQTVMNWWGRPAGAQTFVKSSDANITRRMNAKVNRWHTWNSQMVPTKVQLNKT